MWVRYILHEISEAKKVGGAHLLQAEGDEGFELLAEGAVEGRRGLLGDEEQNPHWVKVRVRRLALGHLHDSHVRS